MVDSVKEVQLLAIKQGTYTNYVFKSITDSEYIMCTRLPNWQVPEINIGDKGFLHYQRVNAGEEYTTPDGQKIVYKYSNVYFINFVLKSDVIVNKEIIL
jgi:hypothetical protein